MGVKSSVTLDTVLSIRLERNSMIGADKLSETDRILSAAVKKTYQVVYRTKDDVYLAKWTSTDACYRY